MAAFEHIRLDSTGTRGVAAVALNRPEAGNAMSDLTLKELAGAFHVLSADKQLRAVVVTGAGKHFCAGADIQWMKRAGRLPPEEGKKDARLLVEMLSSVQDCPVPVIVAAQGAVYGGGLGLLAACDISLASEDAKFCFSECRLGIMPAVISCFVLPKIGAANARRYYATAEVFGAERAKQIGLLQEAVPAQELAARAFALAESVAKNGPRAVREAKKLLLGWDALAPERRVETVLETLVRLRSSSEGQEGLAAFLEKRPPAWGEA